MSTPSTPRSPPPTMIPPPSVASYKFPISPLPSHSAVPWRLVHGLFAPLPDGHTYQPVTLLISWDWIPTTETVRLHFTGAGVECTSFLWPTDQEPSFPPLQRVALFFYADWKPSGRRLRVLFEKDNIIRCEYGYDRELEYDKKWILVLILVELVIPILLGVLMRPSPTCSGWCFSDRTVLLSPVQPPFYRAIPEIHDTLAIAMIDTLDLDPKDPFLIIDPANTIGDLSMELLELCSYIGRWSDLDVLACGKQGARYHLSKAQDGLRKLEHKSYRWINEIVHRLEILATQIDSEADADQKTIDVEQLAPWVLVHLDETAPRYDKLLQIVQNTTRHLRESDQLQGEIIRHVGDLRRARLRATDEWSVNAVDALDYCRLISWPARDLLLEKLERAGDELATAMDAIARLRDMTLRVQTAKKMLVGKELIVNLDNNATVAVSTYLSWQNSVNATQLGQALARTVWFLRDELKTSRDLHESVIKLARQDAPRRRAPRPGDTPPPPRQDTGGGFWEWLVGGSGHLKASDLEDDEWVKELRGLRKKYTGVEELLGYLRGPAPKKDDSQDTAGS